MEWTKVERAFAVGAYFSTGHSIVATQRAFRTHFNIAPRGRVPGRQSIVSWVNNFREIGDVKKKKPGLPRTARSPQNIDAVRLSVLKYPQRSARKHAAAVGLSARSVRRILHEDLNFHPYKLAVVQELNPLDLVARENACEDAHKNHDLESTVSPVSVPVQPVIISKIRDLVAQGIDSVREVKFILRDYVCNTLFKDCEKKPDITDQGYFPIDKNIRNHIYMAKALHRHSKVDQDNFKEKDKAGVSRAGADVTSRSVTDPVWSDQENALGSNQEIIEKQHSRSKEIKTEQSSSDEYLDGNESKVYTDVAEHPEDLRKRKHSMGNWEEFPSVSDGRKYIKSEDDIDEKIDISKECIFAEPYEEQNTLRDRS